MDANQTKRIAEIRQRAEAEPSGPRWTHSKYLHCVLGDDGFGVATLSQNRTGPTIEFISHSRSDIPYLLDLIQEQAAEIERLQYCADYYDIDCSMSLAIIEKDAEIERLRALVGLCIDNPETWTQRGIELGLMFDATGGER